MKMRILLIALICSSAIVISCKKEGCTNENASNFDAEAKKDDGSCIIPDTGGVRISMVVAYPDLDESVTITNTADSTIDIAGWTIGDLDDQYAFSIPATTTIASGATKMWLASAMGFFINDSNETIYLRDDQGDLQDSWSN